MVYKKYIKRGGKVYGPYLYHNVKRDGRVITTYHGKHEAHKHKLLRAKYHGHSTRKSKKLLPILTFLFILTMVLSVNLLFLLQLTPTGKVSIEIQDVYKEGDQISGDVRLVLKHGELFPAETTLIIDSAGSISEYVLQDLVSQDLVEGNFYVEDKEIVEFGGGYGVLGEKEVFPIVIFSFRIVDKEGGEEPSGEVVETSGNETNETIEPSNETETPPDFTVFAMDGLRRSRAKPSPAPAC